MTPELVIFDMAGTTIEDRGQVPAAFAETLAANNITITADEIARVRGASKRQAIRSLLPPHLREDASARQAFDADAVPVAHQAHAVGVFVAPDESAGDDGAAERVEDVPTADVSEVEDVIGAPRAEDADGGGNALRPPARIT